MFRHADRPHARPAAAVRNAKGFVQIQMANVRADVAGAAEADLRVHIRAVHVNLAAVLVNDFANLLDAFPRTHRAWKDRSPSTPPDRS